MSEQMISAGRWNSLKGELKSRWAALTDSDLQQIGGNVDKLVGTIQQKTGETQQDIEKWLRSQGYGEFLKSHLRRTVQEGGRLAERMTNQLDEYSWSDVVQMLEQNIALTIAGALLVGFGLGRLSKSTYGRQLYVGRHRGAWRSYR
jgi:uncharacterized protein YjbJ (UPF0337 family)